VLVHVFFHFFYAHLCVSLFVREGVFSRGGHAFEVRTNVLCNVTLYRNYWRGRARGWVGGWVGLGFRVGGWVRAWMKGCREGGNAHVQGIT